MHLYTVDSTLETLRRFDIREADLDKWETELGLSIPVDEHGEKQYSPHHVNLFKNIKKHLTLGRTLGEIARIIALPPMDDAIPTTDRAIQQTGEIIDPTPDDIPSASAAMAPDASEAVAISPPKAHSSSPAKKANPAFSDPAGNPAGNRAQQVARYSQNGAPGKGAAGVVQLVNKLSEEKDHLFKKLVETEKLNSHLFSANNMFHKKVKELNASIRDMKEQLKEDENLKLLNDKAQLQKQFLEAEKKILDLEQDRHELTAHIRELELRLDALKKPFNISQYIGDWMEQATLETVEYDNFGINVDAERSRLFRISEAPARVYGHTAIIPTQYQYETNKLWKRHETLTVHATDENTLDGELTAEYILDGVPVARALYRVHCERQ
ncbi:MAG: MerR family transcriptional regulator [Candidatus Melainabacteria bacterium]